MRCADRLDWTGLDGSREEVGCKKVVDIAIRSKGFFLGEDFEDWRLWRGGGVKRSLRRAWALAFQ
jgi:hypothetical protein